MASAWKGRSARRLRLEQLRTARQVLADELKKDLAFRREWERLALGRAVALRLVQYRAEHGLSQADLAERLGVRQPYVAALERGDRNPQLDHLARLANVLGISFLIEIQPRRRRRGPRWLTAAVERAPVVERAETEGSRVLVAAG